MKEKIFKYITIIGFPLAVIFLANDYFEYRLSHKLDAAPMGCRIAAEYNESDYIKLSSNDKNREIRFLAIDCPKGFWDNK